MLAKWSDMTESKKNELVRHIRQSIYDIEQESYNFVENKGDAWLLISDILNMGCRIESSFGEWNEVSVYWKDSQVGFGRSESMEQSICMAYIETFPNMILR